MRFKILQIISLLKTFMFKLVIPAYIIHGVINKIGEPMLLKTILLAAFYITLSLILERTIYVEALLSPAERQQLRDEITAALKEKKDEQEKRN